jgi:hypothetical protein
MQHMRAGPTGAFKTLQRLWQVGIWIALAWKSRESQSNVLLKY